MRLYFFPALLPLAPLLPWLLTGLGAIAAVVRKLQRRRAWAWVAAGLFVAAGAIGLYQRYRLPDASQGTRLTPREELPRTDTLALPGAAPASHPPRSTDPQERSGPISDSWFRMNTRKIYSATLAAPGLIIAGTEEGDLQAYRAATGEPVWTLHKSQPILSPAAQLGTTLYVGEGLHTALSSTLTAIEATSGRALWQRQFLGHLESKPALDEARARLYVTAGPQGLWAIEARDGAIAWRARIGHIDSTPTLAGESLWVTAQPQPTVDQSELHELDPSNGQSRFHIAFRGQPWGETTPVGDLLLFSSGIGQVGPRLQSDRGWSHAFSVKDRKLAWSVALETMPLLASPVSTTLGLVFHTLKSGEVVALRIRDGSTAWTTQVGSSALSPATLIEQGSRALLAALPETGDLVLLDARTGREIARRPAGMNAIAPPLLTRDPERIVALTAASISAFDLDPPPTGTKTGTSR